MYYLSVDVGDIQPACFLGKQSCRMPRYKVQSKRPSTNLATYLASSITPDGKDRMRHERRQWYMRPFRPHRNLLTTSLKIGAGGDEKLIGVSAASPTLVVKTENCLYICKYICLVCTYSVY